MQQNTFWCTLLKFLMTGTQHRLMQIQLLKLAAILLLEGTILETTKSSQPLLDMQQMDIAGRIFEFIVTWIRNGRIKFWTLKCRKWGKMINYFSFLKGYWCLDDQFWHRKILIPNSGAWYRFLQVPEWLMDFSIGGESYRREACLSGTADYSERKMLFGFQLLVNRGAILT